MTAFDPRLDLTTSRVIRAPRALVWGAWTDPASLEQWWIPAPLRCRVLELDVRPGGAFVTAMSEDRGPFHPHLTACFLEVVPQERIVFTDALTGGWRPAGRGFMTAVVTLTDHPEGVEYVARALHADPEGRDRHETLGFHDGWTTVTRQLAELVEGRVRGAH